MSHETKPLWLINPRLDAGEYRNRLMGSCVKYPDLPTEKRIPYRTSKLPLDMVPNIDPKPVQVHNVTFWTNRIKDARVSASLNEILEAFGQRAKQVSSEKVATVARMWHMDSPGDKFQELLKNKQYFEELYELLQHSDHQQAYFITDIVTLVNMEMRDETGRSNGVGASAKVPLDPSLTGVNVGAGGRFGVVHEKGHSARYEEEVIVFLGYRLVRLDKVDGTRAKLGRVFGGHKYGYGFTIRDGMDYWPQMVERPVEGDAPRFLTATTPKTEEDRQLSRETDEHDAAMSELGFDVMVVG